jgi:hypothetical protein
MARIPFMPASLLWPIIYVFYVLYIHQSSWYSFNVPDLPEPISSRRNGSPFGSPLLDLSGHKTARPTFAPKLLR